MRDSRMTSSARPAGPREPDTRAPSAPAATARAGKLQPRRGLGWLALGAALAALVLAWGELRERRERRTWDLWLSGAQVPVFHLWLDADAQASLGQRPREFVHAELEHEGRRQTVAVRLKGHRSMRPLSGKPAFKLAFDKPDEDGRFLGARRLTLNNMVEDPTSLRELLGYRVFRALGIPAPRAGHASVFVNGEALGVYAMLEDSGRIFATTPGGRAGVVYEGEYGCDVVPEDVPGFDRDHGKDPGRAALTALAQAASAEPESLFGPDGPLDTPAVLRFLAASAIIGDFDGYRHSHNYRLHRDARSGKWRLAPWGLDRVFKRSLGIFDSQGRLAKLCFADAGCRLDYVRTVRDVLERFESLDLLGTARVVAARIDAAPAGRQPFSASRVAAERLELERFLRRRPAEIRAQLGCIDAAGGELDRDADGHGCGDCDDGDPEVGPHAAERCDGVDNDCSGLVDDAAECECERRRVDGQVYHFCNLPMPWPDAQRLCEQKGLVLARVGSKRVSRQLHDHALRLRRQPWWIGYSDLEVEGEFRWREGDRGSFRHWDRGQPNNRSCNEDCAALRPKRKGKWQDSPCHLHRPFICSARAEPEASPAPP